MFVSYAGIQDCLGLKFSNISDCLVFRFVCTAMKSGSGIVPYLAEVYSDLITLGVKGTVSDVCLTGSVQWD